MAQAIVSSQAFRTLDILPSASLFIYGSYSYTVARRCGESTSCLQHNTYPVRKRGPSAPNAFPIFPRGSSTPPHAAILRQRIQRESGASSRPLTRPSDLNRHCHVFPNRTSEQQFLTESRLSVWGRKPAVVALLARTCVSGSWLCALAGGQIE